MKEYEIFYNIKELEKIIIKSLFKTLENQKNWMPTPTQMRIVDFVLNNYEQKDISQKEIENGLNLSKATVSDVLNRMEKKGLIIRKISDRDTRKKLIFLSDKAKNILEMNKIKLQELEKIATQNISDEEIALFSKILQTMIQNLKNN